MYDCTIAFMIIPIALSCIMLFSGTIASMSPMEWKGRDTWIYPMYTGKKALYSKELWDKAQKLYGKWMRIFGVVNLIISYPLAKLMLWFTDHIWMQEDATFPALIILCGPSFIFILLAHILTSIEL
jgi:hypothetical protein